MTDLTFEKNPKPPLSSSVVNYTSAGKKGWGCGGCLGGCLGILLLICLLVGGSFAYLYFMDKDEALGAVAVYLLKNQTININLMADINNNQNISENEKIAIKIFYDKFLSDYDAMPKATQKKIKKNFGVLIKKFINNPGFLLTEPPPPELKELIAILAPVEVSQP